MGVTNKVEDAKARKLVARYNMLINLFWSIVNLAPIGIFWFKQSNQQILYIFLLASLLPILLPKKVLDSLVLGSKSLDYKRAGVVFIIRFTQNGHIVNSLVKKKYPNYRVVSAQRSSIEHLLNYTYMFEKFHYIFLIFFNLTLLYALVHYLFWWSVIILLTNILYNVYPILIQQSIRLKLYLINNRSLR